MRWIYKTVAPLAFTKVVLIAIMLSVSTPAHANPQRAQAQANFKAADVDRNEKLNMDEFKTFINLNADQNLGKASSVRRHKKYKQAFKKADKNGDGVVTKEEIAAQAQ